MADYGRGTVYKRGQTWWIQYWTHGHRIRESSRSTVKADATDLLNKRLGEDPRQRAIRSGANSVTFGDLAEQLRLDYKLRARRSADRMELSLKHLEAGFRGWTAAEINARAIRSYAADRLKTAKPATINRELAALKRMFRLGVQLEIIDSVPAITMLEEDNIRTGFFEERQFQHVLVKLPEYLKPLAEVGYVTGWRTGELLSRRWEHVDFDAGWIRLEPGETKNRKGRQFPLVDRLRRVLEDRWSHKQRIEKEEQRIIGTVFFDDNGDPIMRWRLYRDWKLACKAAGHPERILHDFRRTAARNLTRAGVPRSVAKQLTGHKTDSVFERYDIVDEGRLEAAGAQLEALYGSEPSQNSHNRGAAKG
jgi:integrase